PGDRTADSAPKPCWMACARSGTPPCSETRPSDGEIASLFASYRLGLARSIDGRHSRVEGGGEINPQQKHAEAAPSATASAARRELRQECSPARRPWAHPPSRTRGCR